MSNAKKLEAATQSPAYLAYSELIGGAIARLVLGDGSALREVADLQKEQVELVRNLTGGQK